MANDWDIGAIVRSCKVTTTTPPITSDQSQAQIPTQTLSNHNTMTNTRNNNPFLNDAAFHQLQQHLFFYKPLQSNGVVLSPESRPERADVSTRRNRRSSLVPTHKKKKNKNVKKVVRMMTKEGLYSDFWSWRKYGQKPIKGSLYPRNYYRCSFTKGCPARKQVERNQRNPDLYIVTYTHEHCHSSSHDVRDSSAATPPPTTNGPVFDDDDDVFLNFDFSLFDDLSFDDLLN